MEEKNKIDEIFKSALDDLEMEPSTNSWDNVSSKLAAKRAVRKRRRAGLWFSAAALLLLLSYTSYRLLNKVNPDSAEKIQPTEQSSPVANSTPATPKTQNNSTVTASTGSTPPVATTHSFPSVSGSNNTTPSQPSDQSPAVNTTTNSSPKTSGSPTSTRVNNQTPSGKNVAPAVAGTAASQGIAGTTSANAASANSAATKTSASHASPQSNTQTAPAQEATNNTESVSNANTNAADNSVTPSQSNPAEKTKPQSGNDNNLVAPALIGGMAASGANNSASPSTPSRQSSGSENSATNSTGQNPNETQPANQSAQPEQQTQPQAVMNPAAPIDSTSSVNPKSSSSLINKIVSHLGLEVYYTPEFAKTNMKVNDTYQGPASKNLDDYKNETSQYCYSAGLNLSYKIGNHWSVVSGYSISDFSKSAVYNTMSVVADSVYQDEYVENPGGHQGGSGGHHHNHDHGGGGYGGSGGPGGGDPGGHGHENPGHPNDPGSNCHYIIHTACGSIDLNNIPPEAINATNGDTLKIKTETFQTIHFYSIPLLVRYSFGMKKVSYFVEAGGAINYVTTDQVKVIVNDATTENNSLDAISTMNYTLLFGVGAKYNFVKNVNFFLKPSLRYSITPINVDSPVKSYPYYMGIGGGFSIDF